MEKLDLSKQYKSYYTASTQPQIVEIEPVQYLSITGKGDPSEKEYLYNIQALYSTAYTLKFHFKAQSKDFVVPKLECLWWFDESKFSGISMSESPLKIPRSEWEYRLLIRMPEFVTGEDVKTGATLVFAKKQLQQVNSVEFYQMNEGKCVQILHVGAFNKEPETLSQLQQFCETNKLGKNGLHHEIYLTDFNRTPAEKLRTILREPVKSI